MVGASGAILELFQDTGRLLVRIAQGKSAVLRYVAYVVFLAFSLHVIPRSIRRAYGSDVQVYRRRLRAHALRRGTVPLREGERAIERYPSDRDRGGSRGQQQDQHYWEGGEEPRDPTKFNQIKYKTVFTKSSITTPNSPAGYSSHVSNEMTAAGSSVLTV
ncbi:uncharacterized protein LOC111259762 [Varroa jacobsoni]|uniref:Uncharacterized protein n=1 Tax=Varroa destructor TaxID=109461 RepID=A0A7M7JC17_VARDE|nr:uncharacterized protein LOC111243873 [Varroa destructor]XP_022687716.1 uncharacterized protein LOC111259762 [Varroa jacobsoni]